MLKNARLFAIYHQNQKFIRSFASHAHHAPAKPQETFAEALKKRYPGDEKSLISRLDQLKKNHMKVLSLDINWNVLKPEEKEEKLRDFEPLLKNGFNTYTIEQKKAVSLANVYSVDPSNIKAWDDILSKNDELQAGDWRDMSLEEKKAAHYVAWGPVPETDNSFKIAVGLRVALMLALAYGIYSSLFTFFRSKKDLPTLSAEHVEARRERAIHERMNPYTGESAHLFAAKETKKSE